MLLLLDVYRDGHNALDHGKGIFMTTCEAIRTATDKARRYSSKVKLLDQYQQLVNEFNEFIGIPCPHSLINCENCADCVGCTRCVDCRWCARCINVKNAALCVGLSDEQEGYWVLNKQVTYDEYREVRKVLRC